MPVLSVVVLALIWGERLGPVLVGLAALFLIGAVVAAVHHAEVVAHRVGEPFGSLVLAAAVTVIEVALIVELMASGGNETATLARDTAFAGADDHHQRHRRVVAAARFAALRRDAVQRRGQRRRAGHA